MSHRSNRMEGAMSSGIVFTITLLVFLLVGSGSSVSGCLAKR
jgi:hypothetical protein